MQTPRRENQQARDGFAKNGLEGICDGYRGMAFLLFLYLVGLHQRAVTGLPDSPLTDIPHRVDWQRRPAVPLSLS